MGRRSVRLPRLMGMFLQKVMCWISLWLLSYSACSLELAPLTLPQSVGARLGYGLYLLFLSTFPMTLTHSNLIDEFFLSLSDSHVILVFSELNRITKFRHL